MLGAQQGRRILSRTRRGQFGVTAIELIFTVALVAVLMPIAVPSFTSWLERYRIRGAAEAIHTDIQLARAEALARNASVRFAEKDFLDSVKAALADTGFPASRLQLEVTEGLLLDPTPETLKKIAGLVECGVRFAIDDFGMGYSSLAFLKTFPLHTLKIDRMFVNEMAHQARDAAIVHAIIDLGHGLGLRVTAEGVETAEQFAALRALGCDTLQGFLFARPLPAAQLQALLQRPGAVLDDDAPIPGWSGSMAALLNPV